MDYEKTQAIKNSLATATEVTTLKGVMLASILVEFEHFSNDNVVKL